MQQRTLVFKQPIVRDPTDSVSLFEAQLFKKGASSQHKGELTKSNMGNLQIGVLSNSLLGCR
jgi:hypothetical protein